MSNNGTPSLFTSWLFFKANAGYATPPGPAMCALLLARAEAWLKSQPDLVVVWGVEQEPDLSFMPDAERAKDHEVEYCAIVRPCPEHGARCLHAEWLESLGNIVDASNEYRRVVVAELALEIME